MKTNSIPSSRTRHGERGGGMIILCLVLVTVATIAAGITVLVSQTSKVTLSRSNMIAATQYAQGAAVIACKDLNDAVTTGSSSSLANNLRNLATPYTMVTGSGNLAFQRTIAAPFSNQTATATITLPSSSSPSTAKITTSVRVGDSTQTATLNVRIGWGEGAAIVSPNAGDTSTSNAKSSGQAGDVAVNGGSSGPMIINGGTGLAVLANGRVNYDTNYLNPPASSYSQTNWGTGNQVPDYTQQGTSNMLFDINRFIAVADLTPNGYNTNTHNNHFTNMTTFVNAMKSYTNAFTKAMQGVVVVDVRESDKDLNGMTPSNLPKGINIKGTFLLNFTGPGWDSVTEKIVCTADINVNAANLSGLVPTDPSTYATGYPPTYTDPTKNPVNIDITSKGFNNFVSGDDLPAMLYSFGCLDMHGNCDVCGVLYTPCYIELENKQDDQVQYINGMVIMGNGIYYENTHRSTSIISYDPNTVDALATIGGVGKMAYPTYWEQ